MYYNNLKMYELNSVLSVSLIIYDKFNYTCN